jgi:glycosyltransferase involved in cell wall biosynthesis
MHELAVAIAAGERAVELRGEVDVAYLDELSAAAGARPELPASARPLDASDTVLVYEGVEDPLFYGRLALSPARTVLLLLAAPGLFGWPFVAGWRAPAPEAADARGLARPEHFQGAAALGFELWTHTASIARAAAAAGVECRLVGCGSPVPFPEPGRRDVDVVTLGNNRWASLAARVTSELEADGLRCTAPPRVAHRDVLELFGRARVVVHPARLEGLSRVGREARAMGAVPVLLQNTFADEVHGSVAVESTAELAPAVRELLSDDERRERLAADGMASAREEVRWDPYLEQVSAALDRPAPDPGREARAEIARVFNGRLAAAEADRDRHKAWLDAVNASASWRLTRPLRWAKRRL